MTGSVPNSVSQAFGKNAAHKPIASVMSAANRRADPRDLAAPVRGWPAPMAVPTIATSGPPKPNASGISRYSSRAPTP